MSLLVLRDAARSLARAVLRVGDEPARRTFVSDARLRASGALVEVSPVPGDPFRFERATLDFEADGVAWYATGNVVAAEPGWARISVKHVDRRAARRARIIPPADRVSAVFVVEGHGLGRVSLPVLDLTATTMRIASHIRLEPETVLRPITLLAQRDVIRVAEGTVVSSSVELHPHGREIYPCTIRLRRLTQQVPDDHPADRHDIVDAARVRATLWALADLGYPVMVTSGQQRFHGRLEPVKGSRDSLPDLRCTLDGNPALAGAVQVECTLYGSGYRFFARVRGHDHSVVILRPAPIVREWHRRDEERLILPADVEGWVEYEHPLLDGRQRRRLIDLSVHGFACAREPDDHTLWPGLPLRRVRVRLPSIEIAADATVRSVAEHRAGAQLGIADERELDRLRVELVKISAKPIELHDGENLDEIITFHRAVKLLEPDMERNLEATLPLTRESWRAAHRHPDGLMRTAFLRYKGGIGATLTLVRAYDSTWVLQHSAVASPAVPANPGMLHSLLVQLAIPRADGEYVCGFIADDARSQHAIMSTFFANGSTPAYRGATDFALYSAGALPPGPTPSGVRRVDGRQHELLVENAALRLLDPVCARALGLRRGELRIDDTRRAFAKMGLVRQREAWGLFRHGRAQAILLRELASPGLALSSVLSASMLLPTAPQLADEDVGALVSLARSRPLPGDPPVRFLFVPQPFDDRGLIAAGFRRVAGCTLYAMHRFGLSEYQRFVSTKYGFLHGRLRARTSSTSEAA
jgi:hypothetical protein